ncbi:DUF3429 domain-containing protein [Pseudomaricurvus alcaniphilus]|uniref:DUF3429 domain-containing protein n=1 Tax=Pseudomaricurvus alcaniphilus TaxID=1166482 RepID=UPI00140AD5E7|nr:DUF3429 domain-containing protein [Pseudomaricurvus alcaniphilus]NHN38880.1 DUF3429 domain-containing protein [Pseudomaricurvus alcaniphilus]
MDTLTTAKRLGYAGLIPFVTIALWFLVSLLVAPLPTAVTVYLTTAFLTYSAIILSFMAGALWGQVLTSDSSARAPGGSQLVVSNLFALTAWASMLTDYFLLSLLALLLGYLLLWLAETRAAARLQGPTAIAGVGRDYRRLRTVLTLVVIACHLVVALCIRGFHQEERAPVILSPTSYVQVAAPEHSPGTVFLPG